jgi:signal peptidase
MRALKLGLRISGSLVGLAVLAAASALLLFLVVPGLVGWELVVVRGASMEPALPVGSLMFVEPVDPEAVGVGDIISYRVPDESESNVRVTHRVAEVLEQDGSVAFRTKGDANDEPDIRLVPAADLEGRVRWDIPHLGDIAQRVRTPAGFLGLMLVPGGIIILTEARNIFRQLRGAGQGGASAGRPREPGQPRGSGRPLWLTVLGVFALGAVVRALRRPAGR